MGELDSIKSEKYLRLVFRVEVIERLEEANVPQLLEKYREEGKAVLIDCGILDLTDTELQELLYG